VDGLQFQHATPSARSDPARADIACFVGFVTARQSGAAQRAQLERALRALGWAPGGDPARTDLPLPDATRVLPEQIVPSGDSTNAFAVWIERIGWRATARGVAAADLFARAAALLVGEAPVQFWIEYAWLAPFSGRSAADLLELVDVPVPIDSWDAFDALFAWDERPTVEASHADTTFGAGVRRFFLQGGRKCYVVRAGDSWPLFTNLMSRTARRERVLRSVPAPLPVDRSTWRGVAHLFGLPDASFLCVPDLPDLFAVDAEPLPPETAIEGDERFIECATRIGPATSRSLRRFPTPRCNARGFGEWSALVARIGDLVRGYCPEVEFLAAIPLPVNEATLQSHPDFVALSGEERRRAIAAEIFASRTAQWREAAGIQTAFVQLAYPWLQTRHSGRLPGGVEPPDAMLAGVLANNALTAGSWRSAARQPLPQIIDLEPTLSIADLSRELPFREAAAQRRLPRSLRDRISVFTPTPSGFHLLTDVTTDDDESYRPANVNRLVAAVVRAARLAGDDIVFMNNGEAIWTRLRAALEELLRGLWGDGALTGAYAAEAFEVRCDRSTMTQSDLDSGRVIARVVFNAASPIEQITIVFALDEGGRITQVERAAAAGTSV